MAEPLACFYICGPKPGDSHPEEWMLVGLVDDGTEQREAIEAADTLDRLMCDCCQGYQPSHHDLVRSGGELLCDECSGADQRGEGMS